MILCSILKFPL